MLNTQNKYMKAKKIHFSKAILITITLCSTLWISCGSQEIQPNTVAISDTFAISYSINENWVGHHFIHTLTEKGNFDITERNLNTGLNKNNQYHLSADELSNLELLLHDLATIKLESLYSAEENGVEITDLPTVSLSYELKGNTDTTDIYAPSVLEVTPIQLYILIKELDALTSKYHN